MLHGEHILIIEDEPVIALDLSLALDEAGARVAGIASTPAQALAFAAAPNLTGAIVDLRLQGQSVRSAVRHLTERAIPFLFYSGHSETPTARSWPMVPLLRKPQTSAAILEVLARVIAHRRDGVST
jgi:CheY-like chemotaxis protein